MALAPGTRIGPYEVIALAGEGGMGQVYRARDTRLNRDVALKVLPELVSGDPDRRARFEREAQLLAALAHPNIATIHGIDETDGRLTLVMEFVDGPTLAERLASAAGSKGPGLQVEKGHGLLASTESKGPGLQVDEAVAIARQICEGLEYAHEHGIIHRDLKPANIKLTSEGTVKILDFGLAKALGEGPVADAVSNSPTLSLGATKQGLILGTAAYMSPEQARGQSADRRADIWAFGCVLFEMLAGRQAFSGATVSDTLAAVLRAEPDWAALPTALPVVLRRLLARCLNKDPKKRFQHIGDVRIELEEPVQSVDQPAAASTANHRRRHAGPLVAAALAGTLATALVALALWPPGPDAPAVARFSIVLPLELPFRTALGGAGIAVSPDGTSLVYTSGGQNALVRRRLDRSELEVLPVTGAAPFFSPDSKWIAFFSDGKLKKASVDGGLATTICDATASRGTWGDDGTIVFSTLGGEILRVPSTGGAPQTVVPASASGANAQPFFLPGSKALLIRSGPLGASKIQALVLADGSTRDLVEGNSPQLTPTGNLIFERSGGLWAVALDTERFALVGNQIPILDTLRLWGAAAVYAVSATGALVYLPGSAVRQSALVWLDRQGRATPALAALAAFQEPRLSPDGRHVAVSVQSATSTGDIWVHELDRGTARRLTTSGGNVRPIWSPDGARIAFQSQAGQGNIGGGSDIYARNADGTGDLQPLVVEPNAQFPDAWTPDGRMLVYNQGGATRDLWGITPGEKPTPLLMTPFNERSASISPDGKWLAFVSDESGRDEIYVQPFLSAGPKTIISTRGGKQPRWSRDGRELFYREEDSLMAVAMRPDPTRPGAPVRLFELSRALYGDDPNRVQYDVGSDGRFLAARAEGGESREEIQVVLNWHEELKTRMAAASGGR